MALIRVTGHDSGIVAYLKTGLKSGRAEDRDDLDERIFLIGDIDELQSVIEANLAPRKKYAHMTISFKEDFIDEARLLDITNFYREWIFSAFTPEEYYFYAEAHIPKIKSIVNENGETQVRKPHIHIVVPNLNLLTGSAVNPWGGKYLHHEKYFDAIQEAMNHKFGLISPSQSRRTDFTMKSSVLEGAKGDIFKGNNVELKQSILDQILESNICSKQELRELLKSIGEHRTRNLEQHNEYEAVKPRGASRFTNLRHYVFSQSFLELPLPEKMSALAANDDDDYVDINHPREFFDNIAATLSEWKNIRSKQIKYLNGNATPYYKSMSEAEKIAFLKEKETAFYLSAPAQDGLGTPPPPRELLQEFIDHPPDDSVLADTPDIDLTRDTSICQLISDHDDSMAAISPEMNALVPIWNAKIDIDFMFAELVLSHGLVRRKYRTSGQERPDEKPIARGMIRCGKRDLSVSDFLRLEMRMRWPKAWAYMRETLLKQSEFIPNLHPECRIPNPALWMRFRRSLSDTKQQLQGGLKQWLELLNHSTSGARASIDLQRGYERFMMFQIKMPEHVRKLFLALIDDEYSTRKIQVWADQKEGKQQLKIRGIQLSSWNLYLSFLHKNAAMAPEYLMELRKHSAAHEIPRDALYLVGRADAKVNDIRTVQSLLLSRFIKENGDIVYSRNGVEHVKDEGAYIVVAPAAGTAAIKAALQLASEKWSHYSVEGPTDLKRSAGAVAILFPELFVGDDKGRARFLKH
jgi:hypothetical protein